jgi:hypothetical protein
MTFFGHLCGPWLATSSQHMEKGGNNKNKQGDTKLNIAY